MTTTATSTTPTTSQFTTSVIVYYPYHQLPSQPVLPSPQPFLPKKHIFLTTPPKTTIIQIQTLQTPQQHHHHTLTTALKTHISLTITTYPIFPEPNPANTTITPSPHHPLFLRSDLIKRNDPSIVFPDAHRSLCLPWSCCY